VELTFIMPLGFQRGTHSAKIPLKARQRSEARTKENEYLKERKYRDERLVWLRNRADSGSLKFQGRPFLWFISFGRAKEMNIEVEDIIIRF